MFYEVWPVGAHFDSTYLIELDTKLLVGDVLQINNDVFLILGNNKGGKLISSNEVKLIGNLFTPTTVFFQQFLKNYWYSWYFKFFRLYIQNTKYILKYKLPIIKRHKLAIGTDYVSKYKNYSTYFDYLKLGDDEIKEISFNDFSSDLLSDKQNLLVFPDNWSLFNFYKKFNIGDILDINSNFLTRYKMFLKIKTGKVKTLLTTHGGVFQDRKKLKRIFVFYPYKWYYKNQQNPRYWLPELTKQIKFFYNIEKLYYVFSDLGVK